MLSLLLPLALLNAHAYAKTTAVCVAGQCLEGTVNITNLGATVETTDKTFFLLPGTYSASVSDEDLKSALTSPTSSVSLIAGFTNSSTNPAPPSLPLSVNLQPGLMTYPSDAFAGQPTFVSIPSSPGGLSNGTSIGKGSLIMAPNTWAAIESANGESKSRTIVWDSFPFLSQLPAVLAASGSLAVIDIQSSICTPACSSVATCSTDGKCICPAGFTGASCETCAEGFFGPQCQKCPDDCTNCDDGPSGTGVCLSSPVPSDAPSNCNCQNGSCSANGQCECLPGWITASNGTACATCADGFFLNADSGNCEACGFGCESCTSNTCTSCANGLTRHPTDPMTCIEDRQPCGSTSFPSGSTCVACNSRCGGCTGPSASDCTSCPSGTFWRDGECLTVDKEGHCDGTNLIVNIRRKGVCDTCPSKCASCRIPSFNPGQVQDDRECTECLPGFALDDGKCVETCPNGKLVGENGTCQACSGGCATCAGSPNFCLTCSGNQLAFNGQCTSTCPTNSFSSDGACIACHPDCATCSGPAFNQCLSCPSSLPVLNSSSGRCLPTCSKTEYFDLTSSSCKACDSSCGTCTSAGSSSCLSCSSDKEVLRGGKCVEADCGKGTGTVGGLGVCLVELVQLPQDEQPPVNIPPLSDKPLPENENTGTVRLEWWQILLMVLGVLFIVSVILIIWRRYARKKRAQQTALFAERLDNRGFWSRFWRNPFSFLRRRHKRTKTQDMERDNSDRRGYGSTAQRVPRKPVSNFSDDWRASDMRSEGMGTRRRSWMTMEERPERRPSIDGRSYITAQDAYGNQARSEYTEGSGRPSRRETDRRRPRDHRDDDRFPRDVDSQFGSSVSGGSRRTDYRPQRRYDDDARTDYGESQFGQEIDQDDRSYYAAPRHSPRRSPPSSASRSRHAHHQSDSQMLGYDLASQAQRGDSPSLYSQVTGVPLRAPQPREPVKDLLTSRFSMTTVASSYHPRLLRKVAPPLIPEVPQLEADVSQPPRDVSDAEMYKMSKMFSELRKGGSNGGSSTAVSNTDNNPFRKGSY